jgi:hypothetical protein
MQCPPRLVDDGSERVEVLAVSSGAPSRTILIPAATVQRRRCVEVMAVSTHNRKSSDFRQPEAAKNKEETTEINLFSAVMGYFRWFPAAENILPKIRLIFGGFCLPVKFATFSAVFCLPAKFILLSAVFVCRRKHSEPPKFA